VTSDCCQTGIDFTKSNKNQGKVSFEGRCLHEIDENVKNPYQKVVHVISQALPSYHEDSSYPVFAFGDITTKDQTVTPILCGV
jgi:E3 ubiquitin-protein ligase RGLG